LLSDTKNKLLFAGNYNVGMTIRWWKNFDDKSSSWYNTRAYRTHGQTDGRTDGRTDDRKYRAQRSCTALCE